MNGNELIKKLKKYAKAQDLAFDLEEGHGKGSHGRIYLGSGFTTIKDRKKEIGEGLLRKMLKDLGVDRADF